MLALIEVVSTALFRDTAISVHIQNVVGFGWVFVCIFKYVPRISSRRGVRKARVVIYEVVKR